MYKKITLYNIKLKEFKTRKNHGAAHGIYMKIKFSCNINEERLNNVNHNRSENVCKRKHIEFVTMKCAVCNILSAESCFLLSQKQPIQLNPS